MSFGPVMATSIDLCVHDLVRASRFAGTTRIIAEAVDVPFPELSVEYFPRPGNSSTLSRANFIARLVKDTRPDVIVVQAHLPTASAVARRCPDVRVVLHSHGFQRSDYNRRTLGGVLHRTFKRERYRRLAGMIHVSEVCAKEFAAAWPDVTIPQAVVYNGMDFAEWCPAASREQEVLCVGRCVEEKGILEAAQAVARVLPAHPGWRARFILSTVEVEPDYVAKVKAALAPLEQQAVIEIQQPFAVVKAANERAAIAIVPSKWAEPFGRTALEAHAGGAALISSGTGGLREASGEHAVYLPAVTADALITALRALLGQPEKLSELARLGAASVRSRLSTQLQASKLDDFLRGLLPKTA